MSTHLTTLVAAGPWHHAEFESVRAAVNANQQWPTVSTLSDAIDFAANAGKSPELILLAQSHPGSDDQAVVQRLHRVAPLTRLIVVAGSWCEGELRTGRPLTGVIRLYWYELAPWWRAALRRVARGERPPWAAPLTDSRAGQSMPIDATEFSESELRSAPARILAIDATDYAAFEALSGGLTGLGWSCVWRPRHRPAAASVSTNRHETPTAGIWDGGQLSDAEQESLADFCHRLRPHNAPVVVLLDFPRGEHIAQVESAGAATLLAKPYQLSLLHNELVRCMFKQD
jgi:DNA-binding NarL/FixJ family response regulator